VGKGKDRGHKEKKKPKKEKKPKGSVTTGTTPISSIHKATEDKP